MKNLIVYLFKGTLLFVMTILFYLNTNNLVNANTLNSLNSSNNIVVEHLRLHVPSERRNAWLKAEKNSWQPWLAKQDGFLGRQILWDPINEEATVLIKWANKSRWKSISQSDVNSVQETFENIARDELGEKSGNPFPLIFEGELLPQ